MKTTRINTGIYTTNFVIDANNLIRFTIEKNTGEHETRELNRWLVTHEIGNDVELWDDDFATKKEALVAIETVMSNGRFEYTKGLGWCYYENN